MVQQGLPLPLAASCVVQLEPQLDEIVNLLIAVPAPVVDHTILFHRLGETHLPEGHPEPLIRFLLHFLTVQERLLYHACNEVTGLVRRIIAIRHV